MLADVVDDLLELAVELKGLGLEAVVGARQGDRRLGSAGNDDEVVRRKAYDDDLDPALPLHDVDGEDTGHRRGRRGDTGAARVTGAAGGLSGLFHIGGMDWEEGQISVIGTAVLAAANDDDAFAIRAVFEVDRHAAGFVMARTDGHMHAT